MTTLASELFLQALAQESHKNARARGRNTIRYGKTSISLALLFLFSKCMHIHIDTHTHIHTHTCILYGGCLFLTQWLFLFVFFGRLLVLIVVCLSLHKIFCVPVRQVRRRCRSTDQESCAIIFRNIASMKIRNRKRTGSNGLLYWKNRFFIYKFRPKFRRSTVVKSYGKIAYVQLEKKNVNNTSILFIDVLQLNK